MDHQEIDGKIAIRVYDFLERYISEIMANCGVEDTMYMCLHLFDISREVHRTKGVHWTDVVYKPDMGIQFLSLLTDTPIEKYTEQQIKDINSRGIDVFFDEGDFLFYSRYGQYVLSSRDIRRVNSQNCLRIGILQKIIERKPDAILFLT